MAENSGSDKVRKGGFSRIYPDRAQAVENEGRMASEKHWWQCVLRIQRT